MVKSTVSVVNPMGLHARPAALLVKTASRFASRILLEKDGEEVDCKSMLSLLMLAAGAGSELLLRVEGADAEQASAAISELFASGFGECEPA